MNALLNKLQRSIGAYAVPNLTWYLVGGQVLLYIVGIANPDLTGDMFLVPRLVLEGEVWRLVTFVFMPHGWGSPLFFFIEMWLLWMFGSALEAHWGPFRFNVYLGVGFLLSIVAAFAFPDQLATNLYVISTIFLAFAFLNPNFELLLFFVLPIKVKWLGLLVWASYGYTLLMGNWSTRTLLLAGVANFVLFFGGEVVGSLREAERRRKHKKDWAGKLKDD